MVLLRLIPVVAGISLFFFLLFSDHVPLRGYTIIYPFTSSWRTLGFSHFVAVLRSAEISNYPVDLSYFFPLIQSVFALLF